MKQTLRSKLGFNRGKGKVYYWIFSMGCELTTLLHIKYIEGEEVAAQSDVALSLAHVCETSCFINKTFCTFCLLK